MAEVYTTGGADVTELHTTRVGGVYEHRLSWGAVFAGLFVALAVMALLAVLGLAFGLSVVDPGDKPANYGLGAGIWGGVSALIAFGIGGWIAGWAKPGGYTANGLLQGALMWAVSMVLLVYLISGGVGSVMNAAGSVAATGVNAASSSANALANNPEIRNDVTSNTQEATQAVKDKANELYDKVTPRNVADAAHNAAGGAWGALVSMLLTLGAAVIGGYFGASNERKTHVRRV